MPILPVVRRGLDQHGNAQIGQTQRVGEAALLAEVRQRDDDAVDLGSMLFEQRSALLGVLIGFDRAVRGLLRREHNRP